MAEKPAELETPASKGQQPFTSSYNRMLKQLYLAEVEEQVLPANLADFKVDDKLAKNPYFLSCVILDIYAAHLGTGINSEYAYNMNENMSKANAYLTIMKGNKAIAEHYNLFASNSAAPLSQANQLQLDKEQLEREVKLYTEGLKRKLKTIHEALNKNPQQLGSQAKDDLKGLEDQRTFLTKRVEKLGNSMEDTSLTLFNLIKDIYNVLPLDLKKNVANPIELEQPKP